MDERRRAAWRALGLGPVWAPRGGEPAPAQADAAARVDPVEPVAPTGLPIVAAPVAQRAPGPHPDLPAPADPPGPSVADPLGSLFADQPRDEPPGAKAAPPAVPLTRLDLAAARARLAELAGMAAACPRCRLADTRTRAVFGVGDAGASWMLVGEGPGAEEDLRGEPFVGQAGRLLDAMLSAIGLHRSRDVYITNVVKCRPPDNRNPQPDEVAACAPYLREQIALVRPKVIVALGRFAAQSLLGVEAPLGGLRGRVHRHDSEAGAVPVVVTYHPAYLLRTPADKAKSWRDLCLAREALRAAAAQAAGAGGPAG